MKYVFERAGEEWIDPVRELLQRRVEWMDEAGIRQWNTTDYLSTYPRSCFETYVRNGWLYVLKDAEGRLAAAAALLESDARWPEKSDAAFYVHHLASDPCFKDAGDVFLKACEALARAAGRDFVRLDCDKDNTFLNRYYERRGYEEDGVCVDGPYAGIRRAKRILPDDPDDSGPVSRKEEPMEEREKTRSAVIVFAGRCRAKPLMNDAQYRRILTAQLPEIIRTRSGINTITSPVVPFFFGEWSSKAFVPAAVIHDIQDNGFGTGGFAGEKQRLYEDMNRTMMRRFGQGMNQPHPYCHVFSAADLLNGLFLIFFEDRVRASSLK